MLKNLPRVSLGCWPTPLYELERLSQALGGPRILIKRDDLSGLATGGNKTRKLELLIADALQQVSSTVITAGAPQSNHAVQTAAATARFGLQCVLVLGPLAPQHWNGNLLLDRLLGARVRWTGDRDRYTVMEEVAAEERAAGRKPYIIPYGGSNAIGAAAYALAMDEVMRQLVQCGTHLDHIVFASSSGGTQAGMVVGARAYSLAGRILGISVDKTAEVFRPVVLELARLTAAYLDMPMELTPEDIAIDDGYLGGGYAVLGDAEREAIRLAARTEGLVVDPVYTGRALAGLIGLIRQGAFGKDETVLFWHTGGTPALFAYAEGLLEG